MPPPRSNAPCDRVSLGYLQHGGCERAQRSCKETGAGLRGNGGNDGGGCGGASREQGGRVGSGNESDGGGVSIVVEGRWGGVDGPWGEGGECFGSCGVG